MTIESIVLIIAGTILALGGIWALFAAEELRQVTKDLVEIRGRLLIHVAELERLEKKVRERLGEVS